MNSIDRLRVLEVVAEAVNDGCRQNKACEIVGVDERTLQRWQQPLTTQDGRRGPLTIPANKLTEAERAAVIAIAVSAEFCNKSPHQIVPTLADRGDYFASESSFYRLMNEADLLTHRGSAKPKTKKRPKALEAVRPNELYSWDITYLLSSIRGQYFYLYMFLDIFSRKVVGWRVYDRESADISSALLTEICERENIDRGQLSLHSDNGGPMKGATMLVTMQSLGIMPSFSRPSVSDDNPFSESLFKTVKHCPLYPTKPFESVDEATAWVESFVSWYNTEHLHSAISFVTPNSRHCGADVEILKKRVVVYEKAKEKNPSRWSKLTRNWDRVATVKLNHLKADLELDTYAAVA